MDLRLPGGFEVSGASGATHRIPDALVEEFTRDHAPRIPGGVTWVTQDEFTSGIIPSSITTAIARFKGEPWYDVKAYGAVGDGVTVDTAAFTAAIAAAPAGGVIRVSAGTYLVGPIVISKRLAFVGAGREISILVAQSSVSGGFVSAAPAASTDGILVADLSIDLSSATAATGLLCRNFHYSTVSNISITGGSVGMDIRSCAGATFEDVFLSNQTSYGTYIDGDGGAELFFRHIKYTQTASATLSNAAFAIFRTSAVDVGAFYLDRVHVTKEAGTINAGILLSSTATNSLTPVFMQQCVADSITGGPPMKVVNFSEVRVFNSWFLGSTQYAMELSGGGPINIEGCRLSGTLGCINITGSVTNLILSGNYFVDLEAIHVTSGTVNGLTLGNNVIGVRLTDSPASLTAGTSFWEMGSRVATKAGGSANETFRISNSDNTSFVSIHQRVMTTGRLQFLDKNYTAAIFQVGESGQIAFGGTAFPTGPTSGDIFYRTDRSLMYFYDGTRWLTTNLYQMALPNTDALLPLTATTTPFARAVGLMEPTYDAYLVDFYASTHIVTTNSSTAFWTIALRNKDGATIASFTTAADAANSWIGHVVSINALLGSTHIAIDTAATKTSTPGNAYVLPSVTYRLVG